MKLIFNKKIFLSFLILLVYPVYAQTNEYEFQLNQTKLIKSLQSSGAGNLSQAAVGRNTTITLPDEKGEEHIFLMTETPVMPEGLSKKYPSIKTYSGNSLSNPSEKISVTIDKQKVYISMLLSDGNITIKEKHPGTFIASAEKLSGQDNIDFINDVKPENNQAHVETLCIGGDEPCYSIGDSLYIYRIGMIFSKEANAEVADGTVEGGLAWVANMVNRINLIWIRDWGSKLILAENSDKLIFTDSNRGYFPSPPFDPPTYFLLDYVKPTLDDLIGSGNYEYGHLVTTGIGGGWAGLYSQKGESIPNYEVMVHEIGHQIGSAHNLTNEDDLKNAWSIGGTIMGNRDNTVYTTDGVISGDQYSSHTVDAAIVGQRSGSQSFLRGWKHESSGNHLPEITSLPKSGLVIPISTPFVLKGNAEDIDKDTLTYTWEENDKSAVLFNPPDFPDKTGPLFVSVFPSKGGNVRYFPNMKDLLKNNYTYKEQLPFAARELNFRLIVRDNNPLCGSYVYKNVKLFTDANSGPFKVETANNGEVFTSGSVQKIKWDVANTDKAPVNCSKVAIYLSTDGGKNFDHILCEQTDNDGEELVQLPDIPGGENRIMIKGVDNIFFDINDKPFTLHPADEPGLFVSVDTGTVNISETDSLAFTIHTIGLGPLNGDLKISVVEIPKVLKYSFSNFDTLLTTTPTSADTLLISGLSKLQKGSYKVKINFQVDSITEVRELSIVKAGKIFTVPGNSVRLNKSSLENIVLPPFNISTNEFSFMAWVKPAGIQDSYSSIFCIDGDVAAALNFRENNELGYHWPGGSWAWSSGLTVNKDKWNHVALVVSDNCITLYLNGKPAVNTVEPEVMSFIEKVRLGSYKNWSNRNYDGLLDEVSFWNKALTKSEVRQYFHSTLSGSEQGLISYFQFNGKSLADGIGNADGSANHSLEFVPTSAPFGNSQTSICKESKGKVNFEDAGVTINYLTQNGSEVLISKILNEPGGYKGIGENEQKLSEQYWVLNRYSSSGIYMGDITFTVENLHTGAGHDLPEYYKLYNREDSGEGDWKIVASASSINEDENKITFNKIFNTGQFLITKINSTTGVNQNKGIPDKFKLFQNYPNPFNPNTIIKFALPERADVRVEVYNILGVKVATLINAEMNPGIYHVEWKGKTVNGNRAASGLYIYKLITGHFNYARKMILLK